MQGNNHGIVLQALRANAEYSENGWLVVYLDNARPAGMSDKVFRAALAQLSKRELYKVIDGFAWGKVKMAEEN